MFFFIGFVNFVYSGFSIEDPPTHTQIGCFNPSKTTITINNLKKDKRKEERKGRKLLLHKQAH